MLLESVKETRGAVGSSPFGSGGFCGNKAAANGLMGSAKAGKKEQGFGKESRVGNGIPAGAHFVSREHEDSKKGENHV